MKTSTQQEVIITISCSKQEAAILMGLVQNPVYEEENYETSQVREQLFKQISDALA